MNRVLKHALVTLLGAGCLGLVVITVKLVQRYTVVASWIGGSIIALVLSWFIGMVIIEILFDSEF